MTDHAKCPECRSELRSAEGSYNEDWTMIECPNGCWKGPEKGTEAEAWAASGKVVGAYWREREWQQKFGPAKSQFERLEELEQRLAALEEQLRRDPTPDAEPPGSPTVMEKEDLAEVDEWTNRLASDFAAADEAEYGPRQAHLKPRRECWEVRYTDGKIFTRDSEEAVVDRLIRNMADRKVLTKHRMVEVGEGERIVDNVVDWKALYYEVMRQLVEVQHNKRDTRLVVCAICEKEYQVTARR